MGCHCHIIRTNKILDNKTKLLLSISTGMTLVHQRLKAGRAIMLCCIANNKRREALINIADAKGTCGSPSIVFGTT